MHSFGRCLVSISARMATWTRHLVSDKGASGALTQFGFHQILWSPRGKYCVLIREKLFGALCILYAYYVMCINQPLKRRPKLRMSSLSSRDAQKVQRDYRISLAKPQGDAACGFQEKYGLASRVNFPFENASVECISSKNLFKRLLSIHQTCTIY
jgi:hypothetical protein